MCIEVYSMYITHTYIYTYKTYTPFGYVSMGSVERKLFLMDFPASHGMFMTPEGTCLKLNRFYLLGVAIYIYIP